MTPPESTEPRTAARDVIFSALDGARVVPPDDLDTATDAVLAVLATIASTEPGRVEIALADARLASSVINSTRELVLLNIVRIQDALKNIDDVQDVLERAIAAAERAATGEKK